MELLTQQAKALFYQMITVFYPLEENATIQIGEIPVSNNTVKRRMDEIPGNEMKQLISAIKHSGIYSSQSDEITDIIIISLSKGEIQFVMVFLPQRTCVNVFLYFKVHLLKNKLRNKLDVYAKPCDKSY